MSRSVASVSHRLGSRTPLLMRRLPISPVVSLRVWFPGGARSEARPGLAWLTGALLAEGTVRRSHRQLARAVEERGMVLSSFGGVEGHGLAVEALADDWREAVELAAEVTFEPRFAETRCRWLRRQGLAELRSQLDQPELATGWAFLRQLWGENHARGRPLQGSETALRCLDAAGCRSFHDGRLDGAVVAIAGRIPEEECATRVAELFGAAAADRGADPEPAGQEQVGAARQEVPLPGAEQAHLMLGHRTVVRSHPDHAALELLAVVLGSGAGLAGRIPGRIREQDGLAYAASAGTVVGAGLDAGVLQIHAGVASRTVGRAERAVREELDRLLADGVEERELEEARGYLVGRSAFRRETARQWSGILLETELYGLPPDDQREEQLTSISVEELLAVARRHIRPAELRVTVGRPV